MSQRPSRRYTSQAAIKYLGMKGCKATRVKTIYKGGFGPLSKILDSCNTALGSGAGFFPFMRSFDR